MYLMDQKCRATFTNHGSASALVQLFGYNLPESSLSNLVLAFYAMSKVAACREFMMAAPLHIDRILMQILNTSENPRIKANSNRAYKTLNADVNEAIEEGAVATLIAMSIEVRVARTCSGLGDNAHLHGLGYNRENSRTRLAMSSIYQW